jgi:predicted lysophospholipase L1 biosynthesis ABC-type transport system permease subunit
MAGLLLWARSEIRGGWRSLIVVAGLIAVVVGSVLALMAGANRAGSAPHRFAERTELADILVFVGDEASPELIESIASDARVEQLEVSRVLKIGAGGPAGWDTNAIIGADDPLGGYGRPLLTAGRYPEPGRPDEIMLNERGAEHAGLDVGDRVPLSALACMEGCDPVDIGDADVVGIVRLHDDLVTEEAPMLYVLAGPDLAGGRWREADQPGTILSLQVVDGTDLPRLSADLSTVVGSLGNVSDQEVDTETIDRAAALQRDALRLAAAVAAAAGGVVVAQAVARHLQRRPSDAVVLDAIGLGRRQRMWAAVISVGPAVLAGAIAGVGIAVAASPAFPLGTVRRAEPQAGFRLDPVALPVGLLIAVAAVTALSVAVAIRWARTAPAPAPASRGLVATLIENFRLRPAAATGARFALDAGHGAQRLPVIPTLLTVTATVAVGATAMVVHTNLERMLSTPARFGQPWAFAVSATIDHEDGMREVAADPRVAAADLARQGEVDARRPDGGTVQLLAIGIDGIEGPTSLVMRSGRAPIGVEEVALAGETMADLGAAVGDRIELSGPCGEQSPEVVGEAIAPLVDKGDPGEGIVLSLAGFDALCADQLTASIDRTSSLLLQFDDAADADAVAAELARDGAPVDRRYVPTDISSLRDVRQVPGAVGIVVAGFGLIAVAHALVLAVRRRRRDLGVLRALGMRPGEAAAAVRWQALTIAGVAVICGIPLGLAAGRALWVAIARPIHVLLDVDLPPVGVVTAVIAVVLTAAALAVIPARRAARLAPAEILRSE